MPGSLIWMDGWVTLIGEWDLAVVDALNSAVALSLLDAERRLQVDMSAVTFIDSSVIAALVLGDREGLDVVIRNPSRVVTRALQLTGCIDLFTVIGP